jgi:hypothetical protein
MCSGRIDQPRVGQAQMSVSSQFQMRFPWRVGQLLAGFKFIGTNRGAGKNSAGRSGQISSHMPSSRPIWSWR